MLKKLALYDSVLIVEHNKLMPAHEGLKELHLHCSNVYTHNPDFDERPELARCNDDSLFQIWTPSDFSALKALRLLNIRAEGTYSTDTGCHAKWDLCGFRCLQELTLQCVGFNLVSECKSSKPEAIEKVFLRP